MEVEREPDAPRPGTVEGDDEFRYPTTDLLNRFAVHGHVIRRLSEDDLGVLARAEIEFSNGQTLVLDYTYSTEKATGAPELSNREDPLQVSPVDGAPPRR